MLRSVKPLIGYRLQANDGKIGHCQDFLFDDQDWAVRYLVADTGNWLPDRKVLISPISLDEADWASRTLSVDLSVEQIENSPPLSSDAPVSRQYESRWIESMGYAPYWIGPGAWGGGSYPAALVQQETGDTSQEEAEPAAEGRSDLRSTNEVSGYGIEARDGGIGHVEEFILNDESWLVHFLVIDTKDWLPGRKVLVAPAWIDSVDWEQKEVKVDLTREEVKGSPTYNPSEPVNAEQETLLYDYYGRPRPSA